MKPGLLAYWTGESAAIRRPDIKRATQSRNPREDWRAVKSPRGLVFGFILLLSAGIGLPSVVEAQAVGYVGRRADARSSRWAVMLFVGAARAGPSDDIELALRDSGWDEPLLNSLTGDAVEHPRSARGDASLMLAAGYRISDRLVAELVISRVQTGESAGYRDPVRLRIEQAVFSVAPIIATRLAVLRLGMGPAVHFTNVRAHPGSQSDNAAKLGLLGDVSLSYPTRSAVFIALRGQYRWVGDVEIGPFSDVGGGLDDFPPTRVDFSHTFFAAGIGFRF